MAEESLSSSEDDSKVGMSLMSVFPHFLMSQSVVTEIRLIEGVVRHKISG